MRNSHLEATLEKLEDLVRERFDSRGYKNFRIYEKQGGTRVNFVAEWGPADERRIIKVDKPENLVTSPRAKRHIQRGCNTSNELSMLSRLKDAELNHFVNFCDFDEIQFNGYKGSVVVEKEFENSESLESYVQNNKMKLSDVRDVFSQLVESQMYLKEVGMYHRDFSPQNILVRRGRKGLEVKVTDLANACKREDVQPNVLPTMGAHIIADPLLIFNGDVDSNKYGYRSEALAFGVNLHYSITGKNIFEFDPDKKSAVVLETGEELVEDGELNRERYEKVLKRALKKLPWKFKRFNKIIRRCLTLDEEKRYNSIDDLANDWGEYSKPGFFEDFFRSPVKTSSLVAALGLIVAGYGVISNLNGDLNATKKALEIESKRYKVSARVDGSSMTIKNNLVELDYTSWVKKKGEVITCPQEEEYLVADQGDEIYVSFSAKEVARPKIRGDYYSPPGLEGRIYLEGHSLGKKLSLFVLPYDTSTITDHMGWFGTTALEDIKIPENLENGTYSIVMELYSPEELHEDYLKRYNFLEPGKILAREKIPVVVGMDPKNGFKIPQISITIPNSMVVKRLGDYDFQAKDYLSSFNGTLNTLDEGFSDELSFENVSGSGYGQFKLPKEEVDGEIFAVELLNGEQHLTTTYFTARSEGYENCNSYYFWEHTLPDKDFYKVIYEYQQSKD